MIWFGVFSPRNRLVDVAQARETADEICVRLGAGHYVAEVIIQRYWP